MKHENILNFKIIYLEPMPPPTNLIGLQLILKREKKKMLSSGVFLQE